ncbi:ABC transporter ATP-binding protein [Roseovarius spongiae]|uniref:ABC transporter ATP-binding protein n=1 Tax=Roseovarius spongiae TaxID=2320272 RepID=A0A3A8ARW6_9RHOB|nr:ABC transporter ATP-binding protein [Roseovarius spongiae]RKF12685.1 ABC transporter ATP-binding protein [Roseovarius spongiae]
MNASSSREQGQPGTTSPLGTERRHHAHEANGDHVVELRGVSKRFGSVTAVEDANLALREGTLTSLLGPSGCGKTTLLRLIAGLENCSTGTITIKGRSVDRLPIHKRNIGLVFQNYALFPHKTIGQNIAFGLKHRKVPKALTMEKVKRALEIVRLPGIEDRYPNQLSGGQQQRVALARAVVFEPDVLLLDEPLSALDANLREEMRVEIKLIQRALGVTTILVTHDQQEALAMSDEIVVMNQGSIQQVGHPKDVYRRPCNPFVAGFLGQANVFPCTIIGGVESSGDLLRVRLENGMELIGDASTSDATAAAKEAGKAATIVIRSSEISLSPNDVTSGDGNAAKGVNQFSGQIVDSSYLGDDAHYLVNAGDLSVKVISRFGRKIGQDADQMLDSDAPVGMTAPHEACRILFST